MYLRPVLILLFASALVHADEGYSFAILGDRTGETVPGVYEQIWREVAAQHPQFAINVGDTIQGLHTATAESEWRAARAIWTRYRIPFYLTPGNHDIWSDSSRILYERETGRPASYSFDFKNAHFTVLDNSRSWQLSDDQMAYLEKDLKAHAAAQFKFVFFHQPFWLLPLKLGSTDFALHALMRKYKINYVVCGHVHQYTSMQHDGVVYLMVGSSGGHLRGHDPFKSFDLGWFYQHVLVRIAGSKIEATVYETGQPFGKGRTIAVP